MCPMRLIYSRTGRPVEVFSTHVPASNRKRQCHQLSENDEGVESRVGCFPSAVDYISFNARTRCVALNNRLWNSIQSY